MANNQSVRRHLDAFTRGRIIGKLEEGRSVTSVAAEFGIAHSIVSRLWRQFQTTGTAIRGFSRGRPRGTTPADDRTLSYRPEETGGRQREKSLDTRHRRLTTDIAFYRGQKTARWWSVCTTPCTVCTFNACPSEKAFSVVPGTPELRDNEWGRVHFTDESRFSLSSDSHRILIWREREAAIITRTSLKGTGSVNGTRYCNEILLPYVRLFRGAMGLQFLFMDDNAPCHCTVAAEQLLESEPARSPDLNPIENVWNFFRQTLGSSYFTTSSDSGASIGAANEWAAMPQQLIDTLILSMGRRCETCLAVRGDHIPY
ncbi:transposable element Tcb2 transposase [Trichonephila clavipes]|uniref:Transposable element Tcb2 transposase n=1 Tax=Trichonephila clavipes TaxID=2585209 RepID=A0A8X6S4N7_TRICX|nr:transposable element Tcb2 transposase [Trichonephila clavipes]